MNLFLISADEGPNQPYFRLPASRQGSRSGWAQKAENGKKNNNMQKQTKKQKTKN